MIGYLCLWIFQFVFTAFYLYSARNRSLLTTHVVEVVPLLAGYPRVVRRPGFAAVYISAVAAHIIPRRAFASDQQVVQFVALVEERMRAAQRTS